MRLAYITASSFPNPKASAVQVMQMCAAFAAAGADTTLIARAPDTPLPPADLMAHYGLPLTFTLDQRPFSPCPLAAHRFQLDAARTLPPDTLCYARGRDLTAPLVTLWAGQSAAVEVHGRPANRRERWMLRQIAHHPRGRLITITEPLRDIYLHELGYPPSHVHVAPDGVDLQRFTPQLTIAEARPQLHLDPAARYVVYVGGLYDGRGLEDLFAAMHGLPATLLIVGGRDVVEIARWQTRLAEYGLPPEQVIFAGYQPPASVPAYLFAADILAMPYSTRTRTPSGEDTTAFMSPLKMFEYLAAGRPIVASDLPALRTTLTHEHNALLAPPDDAAALHAALARLLADATLRDSLSTQARATAAQHSWLARAQSILAHFTG